MHIRRFRWKILLFIAIGSQTACTTKEVNIRSLSANTATPEAQISAVLRSDDIEVRVRLVNRGNSAFALLKWNLPAHGRLEDSLFDVFRDGAKVDYRGIQIKRAVSDDDYISMVPNREYTAALSLAQAYDVHPKGRYQIQYRAWNSTPDGSKVLSFESNVVEVTK